MGMFTPKNRFSLFKNGEITKNTVFISNIVAKGIDMGGVTCHVWKYEGTFDQSDERGDIGTLLKEASADENIQDLIFGENRDRKYADDAVQIKAVYQVPDNLLDYSMFGQMLGNDTIQLEIAKKTMVERCERFLMPGDIIEMPHLQEVGDLDGKSVNRFYVVDNVVKSTSGYDAAYRSHVMAVTARPLVDSQEFIDFMERDTFGDETLQDTVSNRGAEEHNTAQIQSAADEVAYVNWYDETVIFVTDEGKVVPHRWSDDAKPPNGQSARKVTEFPISGAEGDYIVRIDMKPNRLFRFEASRWVLKEIDSKRVWSDYAWTNTLRNFSTDRSLEDDLKPWEHVSIRDIATPRQGRSIPSPRGKHAAPRSVFNWDRRIKIADNCVQTSDQTMRQVELFSSESPLLVSSFLDAPKKLYSHFYVVYSIKSNGIIQNGELLIYDDGVNTQIHDEKSSIPYTADLDITFSVAYHNNVRKLYYTMGGNGEIAEMTFFVESKVTDILSEYENSLDFSNALNSQYLIVVGL